MKEECLVEETSFRQENGEESGSVDTNMTPKGPKRIVIKHTLEKPLGTINFSMENDDDDNILDGLLSFLSPLSLKYMVQAMMAAAKIANDCGVVINTNLKCPGDNHMNWAIVLKEILVETSVEAVHATVSEFGKIKTIKMQLADLLAFKWSILIGKDAVHVARANIDKQSWDARDSFRALLHTLSVGTTVHDFRKTCFIDHNPLNYSHAYCASVCFGSELDLVNAMAVTLVIKGVGLHWSRLSLASCMVCKNFGYMSLNCRFVKNAADQLRLARIYAKKSAPISRFLAFSGKTWALVVGASPALSPSGSKSQFGSIINDKPLSPITDELEERLVSIESSLVSLAGQIGELVKRLDSLVPTVSQPSPGCQLPVTPPSQNPEGDIVMEMALGKTTSNETAAIVDSSVSPQVTRLKNMLEGLSKSVLSLSAHFESSVLAGSANSQHFSQ
ncbi:hypothetical protein G9A89_009249 [Geosiphon pyriformis]|nr:hypothetical protein G9A89_009249 [Geosiphon pyriformis]